MDEDLFFPILIWVFAVVLITIVAFAIYDVVHHPTTYVMPNGVVCKYEGLTGVFGKATHEFYDCGDGVTYINPETYRVVRR